VSEVGQVQPGRSILIPTTEPKSKSSTAKKDAELRKLLDRPDFHSFDRMMKKLVAIPKENTNKASKRSR
jgi:hypothetical protein